MINMETENKIKREVEKYFAVKFYSGYLGFDLKNPLFEMSNEALTPKLFKKKKDAIKAGEDFINHKFQTEGQSQITFFLEKVYQIGVKKVYNHKQLEYKS